jgi:hypothetical protein
MPVCTRCSRELDPDEVEPPCERCEAEGRCLDCMTDHVCIGLSRKKGGRPPKDPEKARLHRLGLIKERVLAMKA